MENAVDNRQNFGQNWYKQQDMHKRFTETLNKHNTIMTAIILFITDYDFG